jgi:addiction module HigA family antidote
MAKRRPAYQAFPPGDLIREEIEYRGWSQNDLAQIMGRPLQAVNQLINGRKAITARTARELEAALGPDAQFWLNMETSYRLYQESQADPEIRVRAKQHTRPVRETGKVPKKAKDSQWLLDDDEAREKKAKEDKLRHAVAKEAIQRSRELRKSQDSESKKKLAR